MIQKRNRAETHPIDREKFMRGISRSVFSLPTGLKRSRRLWNRWAWFPRTLRIATSKCLLSLTSWLTKTMENYCTRSTQVSTLLKRRFGLIYIEAYLLTRIPLRSSSWQNKGRLKKENWSLEKQGCKKCRETYIWDKLWECNITWAIDRWEDLVTLM
jgi:hypothetical protein